MRALASAAGAQTPAQVAKYNRYLSKHPGAAQQYGANGATYNAAGYPGGYAGTQNYANTYSTQYQKNLATYRELYGHPSRHGAARRDRLWLTLRVLLSGRPKLSWRLSQPDAATRRRIP